MSLLVLPIFGRANVVLFHTGTVASPKTQDLKVRFLVLPTLQHYASSTLNELRSRGWKMHDGYSIYVDEVEWIKLGTAEGGRNFRKRRLEEEFSMFVDEDDRGDGDDGFRVLEVEVERTGWSKRLRTGVVAA
jgi:hypothetical protein